MKIRCINDAGATGRLTAGWVYDVIADLGQQYTIIDDGGGPYSWLKERFEVVADLTAAPPTMVECIDADHTNHLTLGKVYKIVSIDDQGDFSIIDDFGGESFWFKKRFKVLSAEPHEFGTRGQTETPTPPPTTEPTPPTFDFNAYNDIKPGEVDEPPPIAITDHDAYARGDMIHRRS